MVRREFNATNVEIAAPNGEGHPRLYFTVGELRTYISISGTPKNNHCALNMIRQQVRRILKEEKNI